MPEPRVVIPAVKIFSIKEDRTPAEIKESIREAYDATEQRWRAEWLATPAPPPIPTVWEAERLANPFGLATPAAKP